MRNQEEDNRATDSGEISGDAPKTEKEATSKSESKRASAGGDDYPQFGKMSTTEELVEAYNEMVPTATDLGLKKVSPVQMFVDTKVGVRACEQLHAAIMKARNPENQEKTMKKAKRTAGKGGSRTKVNGKTTAKKTTKKKAKAAKERKPRAGALDETKKITWAGKEIPFRGGRRERAELVRKCNGQTVKSFLAKGGNPTTLRNCVSAKLASLG